MHLHCTEDKQLSTRCTLSQQNKEREKQLTDIFDLVQFYGVHLKVHIEKGFIY